MDRDKALALATDHVSKLLSTRNSRGYPEHTVTLGQRVELEIRLAEFLMRDEEDRT